MLVSRQPIPIPSRKVVVDLALRSGSATTQSLSPYDGRLEDTYAHFSDIPLVYIERAFNRQIDYDPTKQKPVAGKYTANPDRSLPVLTRLEDIDASWVYKYYENLHESVRSHTNGGVNNLRASLKDAYMVQRPDGSQVSQSELLCEMQDEPVPADKVAAVERLGYVLRKLHDGSKVEKYSIISFVIAYQKAYKIAGSYSRIKPMLIVEQGVYHMNSDGTFGARFDIKENSGKLLPRAIAWIRGSYTAWNIYFEYAMELLRICDILNIDITKEDPLDYQEDYISSIICDVLPTNKEYILSMCTDADMYHALDLLPNPTLDDYYDYTGNQMSAEQRLEHAISETADICAQSELFSYAKFSKQAVVAWLDFFTEVEHCAYSLSYMQSKSGFLTVGNSYVTFNLNDLYKLREDFTYEITPPSGSAPLLLHTSGLLVAVSYTDDCYYLDPKSVQNVRLGNRNKLEWLNVV